MADDTKDASQDFILLDETELHLPRAGDVVLVGVGARDSFWQDAPEADGFLPALDELISDHTGADVPVIADAGAPEQAAPAPPYLLTSGEDLSAVHTQSLIDIIIDDGSRGPFVA